MKLVTTAYLVTSALMVISSGGSLLAAEKAGFKLGDDKITNLFQALVVDVTGDCNDPKVTGPAASQGIRFISYFTPPNLDLKVRLINPETGKNEEKDYTDPQGSNPFGLQSFGDSSGTHEVNYKIYRQSTNVVIESGQFSYTVKQYKDTNADPKGLKCNQLFTTGYWPKTYYDFYYNSYLSHHNYGFYYNSYLSHYNYGYYYTDYQYYYYPYYPDSKPDPNQNNHRTQIDQIRHRIQTSYPGLNITIQNNGSAQEIIVSPEVKIKRNVYQQPSTSTYIPQRTIDSGSQVPRTSRPSSRSYDSQNFNQGSQKRSVAPIQNNIHNTTQTPPNQPSMPQIPSIQNFPSVQNRINNIPSRRK